MKREPRGGDAARYRWLVDYVPDLPGVFVRGKELLSLAVVESLFAFFLALPPVARALGLSSPQIVLLIAIHFFLVTAGSLFLRRAAQMHQAAFYAACLLNLLAGLGVGCAFPVLGGNPNTVAWILPVIYAAMNGGLPETRPSLFLLLAHTVAPLLTIPAFEVGADPWAVGAPVLTAGLSAGTYHYVAMRTASWRELRGRYEEALLELGRQEEELARMRLAQDLHDSVGSTLSLLDLHAGLLERNSGDPQQVAEVASLTREAAREGLQDLRGVLEALAPQAETVEGIGQALRELARRLAPGVEIDVEILEGGANELPTKARLALVRIFQESLRNAVVHGGARSIRCTIEGGAWVSLRMQDDGAGFDPHSAPSGRGLPGMRTRITELGGTFLVESELGSGTLLHASFPRRVAA